MNKRSATKWNDRRTFLKMGGGASALAYWLFRGVQRAEGAPAPKRLVIVSRPNGSIAKDWLPNNQRGSILEPFADVWQYVVAFKNMPIAVNESFKGGDPHSMGSIALMTGQPRSPERIPNNDNHWNTAESFDQKLARESPILSGARFRSLQLGAYTKGPLGDEPSRALSFSGPAKPLYPEPDTKQLYARIFGSLMIPVKEGEAPSPAGVVTAMEKLRRRRESVLSFVMKDLNRVRAQFPSEARADLEAHETSIREMEKALDAMEESGGSAPPIPVSSDCSAPAAPNGLPVNEGLQDAHARVGAAQFEILRAVLMCDLSRVVTFMWAGGASEVRFEGSGHHALSHGSNTAMLSKIDRYYSQHTAPFIQSLVRSVDPATKKPLIDSTLVWYVSEIATGGHSLTDMPFLLFGGDGVGLKNRGRVLDVGAKHSSNDVWTSIAPVFDMTLTSFGNPAFGPIAGLIG
ncbi:MAG: DUF1552 domain-containing protein [Deltaproteobacteria bacterium]|nr:DUF1552 domain-containing protein [Deltaproteobacteria bacterium]